ncbi:polysaccharide deacetylase family protein [Streptomyces sp. NPDC088337]|uniref:polysaccharide deacetylase family protein n=1 Tax=unclassified Streptomyces TaxID=2593676 RepID=UPI002DDA6FC6|nr:polysaccharide deacetylase family protein [Streptomyces sp. NBC_01788]WSB28262.1 polysaccharide deacetylase family protein [Streptomyces sp. NBC_01788]
MRLRPLRSRHVAVALLAASLLAGCATSVDPLERLGRKAAQGVRSPSPAAADQAYRRWGLRAPLPAPPKPPARPARRAGAAPSAGLPEVVDRIATSDPVVFLTYDDGAEKDPRFVDMVRELRLPVSMFLTDSVVGPGYGHFAHLMSVGADLQNHTLDHPSLRGLPYAGQRAEICGQRDKIRSRFGVTPRLFRPPYGRYDTTTLRAAADCGVSAVVLWRAATTDTGLRFSHGHHELRPGDILLVASDDDDLDGPPLRDRTTRLLRTIQEKGLTVGRLQDYL